MAYGYSRTLTIDKTKVPNTDQTNFPVLFSGTYAYLATVANGGNVTSASGFDIIFTSDAAGQTKLDHEIETYTAASGLVVFWVRVPTVATATNTVIYLWYGNSAITTSQENVTGVWDANFKGVWHLPNGTTLAATDSTGSGFNGTINGQAGSDMAGTGQIDGAAVLDGTDDYLDITGYTANTDFSDTTFTFEAWFKTSATPGVIGSKGATGGTGTGLGGWTVKVNTSVIQAITKKDDATTAIQRLSTSTVTGNVWTHVAVVFTTDTVTLANNAITIYLNGTVDQGSLTQTAVPVFTSDSVLFGKRKPGTGTAQFFTGPLDEIRISNIARSADWITTEYNNQSSPSTFYTIGAEIATLTFPPLLPRIPPTTALAGL